MFRFFQNNKNALLAGSAVLTNMLASNYWIWTSTEMGTAGETNAGKNIWLLALTALGVGLGSMGGRAIDKVKNYAAKHEEFSTFFQRNRNKILGGISGLAYEFIYDYWVFTATPMAGSEIPEPVKKMLYIVAKLSSAGVIGAELGNMLDQVNKMANAEYDFYQNFEDIERSLSIMRLQS